jgi:hypothetical protein
LPRYDDAARPHRGYWRAYREFLRGPVRARGTDDGPRDFTTPV